VESDAWLAIVTGVGGFVLGAVGVGLTWWYQKKNERQYERDRRTLISFGEPDRTVTEREWILRVPIRNESRHHVTLVSAEIDTAPQRGGSMEFSRLLRSHSAWPSEYETVRWVEVEPDGLVWAVGKIARLQLSDDDVAVLSVSTSSASAFRLPISLEPNTRQHWP
jgi:hypothetical protein